MRQNWRELEGGQGWDSQGSTLQRHPIRPGVHERICKVGAAELHTQELIETTRGHSLGEESSKQLQRGGKFWGIKNFPAEICKDDVTEVWSLAAASWDIMSHSRHGAAQGRPEEEVCGVWKLGLNPCLSPESSFQLKCSVIIAHLFSVL